MSSLDRSAVERMEHEWRSRGLRVFSVVTMLTLAAYAVANFAAGELTAAIGTSLGLPIVGWTFLLSRRDPMPGWAAAPLTVYLLLVLGTLLARGQ